MYLQPRRLNNGAQYYVGGELTPSRHSVNIPPSPCRLCQLEAQRRKAAAAAAAAATSASTSTAGRSLRERFKTWKIRRRKDHRKSTSDIEQAAAAAAAAEISYDSLRKIDRSDAPIEEDLKNAPWYQAGIPREIALEMLTQEEVGSFVVRDSTTHPGCYALSVKVPKFDNPSGISHYLITRTPHGGVKLKGLDKEWSSLTALVTHHSVMRELLPCPLRLPRIANNPAFNDEEKTCEQEEDEDYQRLADFSHMMQDLKM